METTKTTKTWKKIVIAFLAAILLVMTPMAVAANVNNAGNLKTVAGISAEAKQKNEFYQPRFNAQGTGIQIIPYHVWYQNNKMYADCYVVNMDWNAKKNINVRELTIWNSAGKKLADASFGTLKGVSVAPRDWVSHRFTFKNGTFKNGNLRDGITYHASTSWTNIN